MYDCIKKQLFDLNYLKQAGEKGVIEEVINLYLEETQSDLFKINIAFSNPDYETIHATVDKMIMEIGMVQSDLLFLFLEKIRKVSKYGGQCGRLCELEYFARFEFDQL